MNSGPTDAAPRPSAIGGYEDWHAYIRRHPHYVAESAAAQELSDALGVPDVPANPAVVLEAEVTHDGVTTSRVSWQLGFGPRTRAWFLRPAGVVPSEAELYDAAAAAHEDTVAKAAGVLGTSYAGMVAHDDQAALRVLADLPGVDANRLGSIGFPGGGGQALPGGRHATPMPSLPRPRPAATPAVSGQAVTPSPRACSRKPPVSSSNPSQVPQPVAWPVQSQLPQSGRTLMTPSPISATAATALRPDSRESPDKPAPQGTAYVPQGTGPAPRIALVGAHGYGARHLENLARLGSLNLVELVSVADPRPPVDGTVPAGVATFASLEELLAAGPAPDVVILATPIQTHAPLALAAIAAGADVYVEKPPMASLAQFDTVLAEAETAGRLVQVGFQSLGSHALPALDRLVASGEIDEVRGVSAVGTWVRTTGYFKRSRWAGKRSLDGTDVVDGVATNALAHAVATGLRIAGAALASDVAYVETDLYRAHATESDDTSVIRVRTAGGTVLLCALTLCADEQTAPSVTLHGTLGRAEFFYTEDRLTVTSPDGKRTETFARTDLLENLLAARRSPGSSPDRGHELLSPLAGNGAFMKVLEAIRTAEPPRAIGAVHVMWKGDGDDAHPVVHGISQLVRRAAAAQATFAELGAPWARELPATGTATTGAATIAAGTHATGVSTLAGTVVTDHLPEDHVWHLGAGVAIQDVDGVNFWDGRTFTRDVGAYVWCKDHGRIVTVAVESSAVESGAVEPSAAEAGEAAEQGRGWRTETLSWLAPGNSTEYGSSGKFSGSTEYGSSGKFSGSTDPGTPLLSERRKWSWAAVDPATWRLTLDFELIPSGPDPVSLGSPGSNGRPKGGYGGFFWRLPQVEMARVWTATAEGEDAVHGALPTAAAPWLAWSGRFGSANADFGNAGPDGGPATLVFLPANPDPWFVRMAGYPGVGLSLAWEHAATASHANPLHRTVTVLVADGLLSTSDIEQLITTLGESK